MSSVFGELNVKHGPCSVTNSFRKTAYLFSNVPIKFDGGMTGGNFFNTRVYKKYGTKVRLNCP
jgi:hypothetical protein